MPLFNFAAWPPNQLYLFTAIVTIALIVLAIVFFFRELSAARRGAHAPQSGNGRFGLTVSRGEKVQMEVVHIRSLSATVKCFRLRPLNGAVDYQGGQFLTFHLGEKKTTWRSYSLCSAPTRPGLYEVAVKRLDDGAGSRWMHDRVAIGDVLTVNNPAGRFIVRRQAAELVFVAAGIGITPILAMITELVDQGAPHRLVLFYSARFQQDLIFLEQIRAVLAQAPNATFIPVLTRPTAGWTGAVGRISEPLLLSANINFTRAELYTCGPVEMMNLARVIATGAGMPPERFHQELFSSPSTVEIETRRATVVADGQTLAYDGRAPLLDFLEEQGITVPCSCRAGVCGTCEVTLLRGEVDSLPSEYLSTEERAQGRCLACISFPKADSTLTLKT